MTALRWNALLLLALTACTPEKTVGDGVSEVLCDGLDDDGDGLVDEGLPEQRETQFLDRDGDGYGDFDTRRVHSCHLNGYILTGGDCDGTNPFLHPGAEELCNQRDEDCDGVADNGLGEVLLSQYLDHDGDGYGDDSTLWVHTCPLDGYILEGGDCDDANPQLHPGAEELCNKQDEDCDGVADNGLLVEPFLQYRDADEDGYGRLHSSLLHGCLLPGMSADGGDCADDNPEIHPGAQESCDGIDNNCNGLRDEDPAPLYLDIDQDGYGTDEVVRTTCGIVGRFWTHGRGDCDDLDPNTHPGAEELCDGHDRDCDGRLDDGADEWADWWFPDADGDGMGDQFAPGVRACVPPSPSMVILPNDCDDADPDPSTGALITALEQHEDEGWQVWSQYDRAECVANHAFPTDHDVEGGRAGSQWDLDLDGDIDAHSTCQHDEHCHRLGCEWDNEDDGVVDGTMTYSYDESGNKTYYAIDDDGDGQPDEVYRWAYDDAGHLILEARDRDGDGLFEWLRAWGYDSEGHLIYVGYDDESDTDSAWVETWEYDDDGHLIDYTEGREGDTLDNLHSTWTYDEDGDILYHSEAQGGALIAEQTRSCSPTDTGARCDLINEEGESVQSWVWDERDRLREHIDGSSRYEYDYNDADQLILSVWWEAALERSREQWDDRGNLVARRKTNVYQSELTSTIQEEWVYDDQNRVILGRYERLPHVDWVVRMGQGETTDYASDGSSRTEGELWYKDTLRSLYVLERDPEGRTLYREDTTYGRPDDMPFYSVATLATWYDDQGRQTTARLVIADEHLDATFPIWSDTLGEGRVNWDDFFALIDLYRANASQAYVLADNEAIFPASTYETWTQYASGAKESQQFIGAGDYHDETWFRNGLPHTYYYIHPRLGLEDDRSAYIGDNGRAYREDRGFCFVWECTQFEYGLTWPCPE